MGDVIAIIRAWLVTQATLTGVVGQRIYAPRLPEGATLPALGMFVRGGNTNPGTKNLVTVSVQFDCWGGSPIEARSVYIALYTVLQSLGGYYAQYTPVVIGANTYNLLLAEEEVSGQDVQDVEYPNYHRVISFFKIRIQI